MVRYVEFAAVALLITVPSTWAQGQIFVTNYTGDSITVYSRKATGDVAPLYTALLLHAQSWAGAIGLIGTLGLVASGAHIVASSLEQPREWRQTI